MSTFCSAFDVPHRKKEDKVVPATVDLYNQNMGGVHSSDQVMFSYEFERKSKSWSRKIVFNLLTCLLMNSCILYKLTVGHPKTRLEFIKDVIDSLASDYKEIEAISVARNQGIANLPGKKERISWFVPIETTQLLVAKVKDNMCKV